MSGSLHRTENTDVVKLTTFAPQLNLSEEKLVPEIKTSSAGKIEADLSGI